MVRNFIMFIFCRFGVIIISLSVNLMILIFIIEISVLILGAFLSIFVTMSLYKKVQKKLGRVVLNS